MNILYLSHCAPDLPDKGEKIRAHHFLKRFAQRHRVHLACFCKDLEETKRTHALDWGLASVHTEVLNPRPALARAAVQFALGQSLTVGYFRNSLLARYLAAAPWRDEIDSTLVYSAAMASYAAIGKPLILDLCDLDSEKWFEYDRLRRLPFLYGLEGKRLRRFERSACERAQATILMTENEASLVREAIPGARIEIIANGVDFDYWQPAAAASGPPSIAFVGQLDYFPNSDGAGWFAREVFPGMRAGWPDLEFVIAGRNPGRQVNELASLPGVRVIASPADVRPILASATAVVAPLRLARGLQNKVLEALAMGKRVLTTPQVARTFGGALPHGVEVCEGSEQWLAACRASAASPEQRAGIRDGLRQNYSWDTAADRLSSLLEKAKSGASM